jgi:signal transduction histidine kinase
MKCRDFHADLFRENSLFLGAMPLSLSWKINLFLAWSFALLALAIYGVQRMLIFSTFVPLESAHAMVALKVSVITCVVIGTLVVTAMMIGLHRGVVRPLLKVKNHAVTVASTDDLTIKLSMKRRDEIGDVAREFDRMVEHLAESRNSQLDIAHRAGMAEIASEVLHNVGNALNTVNTSAQMLGDKLRRSRVSGLSKATNLLAEQKADLGAFFTSDPRAAKLVDYLIELSSACATDQEAMLQELSTLKSRVEHINDVIRLQQTYATQTELLQKVEVTRMLDDAVAMHAELFALYDIQIVRNYEKNPAVALNKSKIMQVLINLVKNGIESMISAGQTEPKMTIATRVEGEKLVLEVTDSGLGIDPANVGSLFRSGFTTKPNGHGFGLHFCANTISAMGGSLTARSEGVGRGATFRIELPTQSQEVHA